MARPQLLFWLEDHGFHRHRDIVFIHESRDLPTAMAAAMKKAIDDGVSMAVFCENDALPSEASAGSFFRENRYHLQCVKYDEENGHAFDRHDSFHALIWRASRASLLKLAEVARKQRKPLCEWVRSDAGDVIQQCECSSITSLARAAGLTTGWIGVAGHVPKPKQIVPRICVYGT